LVSALRSGGVDIAYPISADDGNTLKANGFSLSLSKGTAATSLQLNPFSGPTKDLRVRQAMNYAIDKEAVVKNLFSGNGELETQMIGSEVLGFNPNIKPYAYDQAKAKQLLADAGLANGFSINMMFINTPWGGKDVAEAISGDLKKVGINAQLQIAETSVWLQQS